VGAQDDADAAPRYEPRQGPRAVHQGQAAEVLTVEFEQIEGVQHRSPASVQRVDDGDTIRPAHTIASPSSENDLARSRAALTAIAG
jgi:hypothetical protein